MVERFFRDLTEKRLRRGIFRDVEERMPMIWAIKGIAPKDDLLDCAGRVELAANEFRITQAEDKLRREQIKGEGTAIRSRTDARSEVMQHSPPLRR